MATIYVLAMICGIFNEGGGGGGGSCGGGTTYFLSFRILEMIADINVNEGFARHAFSFQLCKMKNKPQFRRIHDLRET